MVTLNDINFMFRSLRNRIFLIVGRCILKKVINDTDDIQRVNIGCLHNETASKVERIQEYGFETSPPVDDITEGVVLFINGNRDQGIVISLGSRKYKPTDLKADEVCMYCKDSNGSNKNRITIKPDNTIEVKTADNNVVTIDSSGIVIDDTNSNKVEMTTTGIKITDKNLKTIELTAAGLTMLGGTEAYVKGTTHQIALTALTAAMAAIVPVGSSAANIAAIQAAFATFAGTLGNMNSTDIKGK